MRKRTQTTGGSALTPHMFIDINESIKSRFFKSHIYITDGWFAAPPRGKREGHGKQNAHWPNGWMEVLKPIQVEQGMLGGERGPAGPHRAGMLATD